ncbi:MAG: 30S ribosomal protein S5 [Candidatus Cloacimonetes bacterium]|nr:30S ribosomal protein S5 [Candidatus Cloacimonadota bacterium]
MSKTNTEELQQKEEFEEKVVEINRTAKKTKGGNRLSFTALVVVGDKNGRVGAAVGKANDVTMAIQKASRKAKRKMLLVPLVGEARTIPHEIRIKQKAVKILLKPAPSGTGVLAGGPIRAVVEAAGIENIVSKILGSKNKKGNVYATLEALKKLKKPKEKREKRN